MSLPYVWHREKTPEIYFQEAEMPLIYLCEHIISKRDEILHIFVRMEENQFLRMEENPFLLHLQAYSDIPQMFLSAFPAEFLEVHRVCPCVGPKAGIV